MSHQLRHLPDLGFIVAERQERSVIYRLFDAHGLELIEQGLAHTEHLGLEQPDESTQVLGPG